MTEGDDFEPPDEDVALAVVDAACDEIEEEDEDEAVGDFVEELDGTVAFAKFDDVSELAAAVAGPRLESSFSAAVAEVLPASGPAGATPAATNVPTTATERRAAKARVGRPPALSRPLSMLPPVRRRQSQDRPPA
ncbi:MAG TPA: hypothetical protein VMR97_06905 [Acidimicrobiales bacterium]|nr:hypothetical protein [Acidimicrobiales bacterium]